MENSKLKLKTPNVRTKGMFRKMLSIGLVAVFLVACGSGAPAGPTANEYGSGGGEAESSSSSNASSSAPTAASEESKPLRKVTLAMSFIPNVQFAPYYVAKAKGYFAEAGLDVTFDYNFENDVVQRAATNQVEFATASGTSVLLARQKDIPVKTVMTLYQSFPVVFFGKGEGELTAAELKGKSLGIPGRFGESYYALLALLYANNLQESDLTVQEIGFTQAQAVLEDKVEVATGYAMNEPVLLRSQGEAVRVLRVADFFPLAANGIVASEDLISNEPEVVRGFVQASLKGLRDTLDNTQEAFDISLKEIPEANLNNTELQLEVLKASLPYWYSDLTTANGLGYTDLESWQKTQQFMLDTKLLPGEVKVEDGFTNEFIK
jgi:NitT/TauT family transport system substrate-binding protein